MRELAFLHILMSVGFAMAGAGFGSRNRTLGILGFVIGMVCLGIASWKEPHD